MLFPSDRRNPISAIASAWSDIRSQHLRDSCELLIFACSLLLFAGCASHANRLAEPRSLFYDNQLVTASEKFEKLAKSHKRDRDVVALDLAMIDLVDGRAKQAEKRLREVRDRFDHLEQKSIVESTASMWTDDETRSYAGEDYEKVFIRCFLALSNLMHDGGDAEAYSIQVNEKQAQLCQAASERLGEQYQDKYLPVPFGYYLRGILRENTFHDYDDAQRAYQLTSELLPESPMLKWDLERVTTGVHSQPGHGVLYVFGLVGRGPQKIEVEEQATSDALLIADRIVSAIGPHTIPPTVAPIKITAIHVPPGYIDALGVDVNGQAIGPTQTITDLQQIAQTTFEVKRKELMARAIARRVIKKATVYAAKDTMSRDNGLTSLAMDAVGVLWEASESADTRCWGLLPREIQVLRVELPAGRHRLEVFPLDQGRKVANPVVEYIDIVDGENTYAMSYFPDTQSVGKMQISTR